MARVRFDFGSMTLDAELLDTATARATLAAVAALGALVFIHPVNDPALSTRLAKYRRLGTMLARGAINSAALIALLESGVFDELPDLRVVVTTLALGGVLLAGGFGEGHSLPGDAPPASRRHVYIDTMGLHPVLIRSAGGPARRGPCPCRHRLADFCREIRAGAAANGVDRLRARRGGAADGRQRQFAEAAASRPLDRLLS